MNFDLTPAQEAFHAKGVSLARELAQDAPAGAVVAGAARVGLLDPDADLLAVAAAAEALACASASVGLAYALHAIVLRIAVAHVRGGGDAGGDALPIDALVSGETVGGVALAADEMPVEAAGRLTGRVSWVAPLTRAGLVLIGARSGSPAGALVVCTAALGGGSSSLDAMDTAALRGLVCGRVTFAAAPCTVVGAPAPVMATVRVLLAAVGLGMGRRAIRESLAVARAFNRTGAGGEQTVQGLIADAATEVEAARLLTWKAASASAPTLAEASMAKLAATAATQRAVAHATQVIGADSFTRGHVIERLAQDVRALELFAGRTEALREGTAAELIHALP